MNNQAPWFFGSSCAQTSSLNVWIRSQELQQYVVLGMDTIVQYEQLQLFQTKLRRFSKVVINFTTTNTRRVTSVC